MIELPLIFVAGFMGSSHCIGMCGPFAVLLGSGAHSWRSGLTRQIIFSLGRVFTYTVLGGGAGFCGLRLADKASDIISIPAILSVVAGCFLVIQGLATAGLIRFGKGSGSSTCLAGGLLANALRTPGLSAVFIAGIFTGFLPCGLVYGFLGMAASSRDIASGAAIMAVFGCGTIPIMIVTGLGGGFLTAKSRLRILQIAAWCIVLAGAVSIARGVSYYNIADADPATACPLCD